MLVQGRVRLLKVDKESKRLFFTTNLQNSVQSYSLQKSKLLDPSHDHPSPPSVFAISCNSRFLLSTSRAPPTIYLTNLTLQTAPVLLRPYCSSSSVVAAAFHPENEDYFLLAFADGTTAVFETLHFFHTHGRSNHRRSDATSGSGGEIAFIKGLHATGTSGGASSSEDGAKFDGYDPGTGIVSIGNRAAGITAVAFVPGRSATAVTVGADGKCCVVDFTQLDKDKAVLLKSWHVRRPATSLSIICYSKQSLGAQLDGAADRGSSRNRTESTGAYYIAIGRQDGRVLLFDLDGKPLGHRALDADGSRVLDVEWQFIEGRQDGAERPRRKARPSVPRLPLTITTDKSSGIPAITQARQQRDETRLVLSETPAGTVDPLFDFSRPHKPPESGRSKNHRKEPPPKGTQKPNAVSSAVGLSEETMGRDKTPSVSDQVTTKASHIPVHMRRVSGSSANTASTASRDASPERSPPPIPPRPSPKPGGRLSKRHAEAARQTPTYLGIVSKARRMSSNPRITGVVYSPRRPQSPKAEGPEVKSSSSNTPGSSTTPASSEDVDVVWTDAAPEPPPHAVSDSPQQNALGTPRGPAAFSPLSWDSQKSYHTASSYLTSEASDDTVVTWKAGLARRPVPTLQPTPQSHRSPKAPVKSEPKGHISLSISSESRDTGSIPSPASNNHDSELAAHPVLKPSKQHVPKLQLIHPTGEWPEKKGHITVPNSNDTTETQSPISARSDDQIVQWPSTSLKKSPLIPNLHKHLPDPSPQSSPETVKESVTGIVIKGYQHSPSPSKPKAPRITKPPSHIPLPASNSASTSPTSSETAHHQHPCHCAATVETKVQTSIEALKGEMMQQFEKQRVWFEMMMGEREKVMEKEREKERERERERERKREMEKEVLEVEIRRLREQLARREVARGEGGIRVDEKGRRVRDV